MSGRIVFVREGWQLRPSETATADDYAAWVKNGAPPAPTAADIDALVTDEFVDGLGPAIADAVMGLGALHPDNRAIALSQEAIKAALRELLGVKS